MEQPDNLKKRKEILSVLYDLLEYRNEVLKEMDEDYLSTEDEDLEAIAKYKKETDLFKEARRIVSAAPLDI